MGSERIQLCNDYIIMIMIARLQHLRMCSKCMEKSFLLLGGITPGGGHFPINDRGARRKLWKEPLKFCRMVLLLIENGRGNPLGSHTENAWLRILLVVVLGSPLMPLNLKTSWASQVMPSALSVGNLSQLSSRNRRDLSCSGIVAMTSGSSD